MAIKLNRRGFEHARKLIETGKFVHDERDAWSEDQPSARDENDFIEEHGIEAYGAWFLAVNDEKPADTKGHYEFPYGDFARVHRGGVVSAESRAGQYKHLEVERAAATLLAMIDATQQTGHEAH